MMEVGVYGLVDPVGPYPFGWGGVLVPNIAAVGDRNQHGKAFVAERFRRSQLVPVVIE